MFGCAMAHRAVLQEAAASDSPGDCVWAFEDGAHCPTAPDGITSCLEGLLGSALQRGHLVDIVYCGQPMAKTAGKVFGMRRWLCPSREVPLFWAPPRLHKIQLWLVSYLVRRSRANYVCDYLVPAAEVLASDGAMMQSYTTGALVGNAL